MIPATLDLKTYKKNYELNSAALRFAYPDLSEKIAKLNDKHSGEISGFIERFLSALPESATQSVWLPSSRELFECDLLIIEGVGLHESFAQLTALIPATTTVVVIEKDIVRFLVSLYLIDYSALIEGWQVKFIIDIDAADFDKVFAQYYFEMRTPMIASYPDSLECNRDYYETIKQRVEQLAPLCRPKRTRKKTYRFLMMVGRKGTGWPYIMQDIIAALHSEGHEVTLFHLESGNTKYQFSRVIRTRKPDFIFLLDAIGLMHTEFQERGVPYISWFFDNPFNWLKQEHVSSNHIIFVWDKTYVPELKQMGFEHTHYLPLGANTDVFYPRPADESLRCDVSFAGSSLWDAGRLPFKDQAKRQFLSVISDALCEMPWRPIRDIIDTLNAKLGTDFKLDDPARFREFELFIQNHARSKYRKGIIESALPFGPHLYGDDGWQKYIKKSGAQYLGRIDNRIGLPTLYSSSAINLNVTVPQIRDSFSHRAFEIPACNGFLLSDYRPEVEQFFEFDREIVCFRTPEEMADKIRYYLQHPSQRNAIAEQGRQRVCSEHTYKHRIKHIIALLKTIG